MTAFQKGLSYKLHRDKGVYPTPGTPDWVQITAVDGIGVALDAGDVVVPAVGIDTGHLMGKRDPSFTFTILEETDDTDGVVFLATALMNQDDATNMVRLAVAQQALSGQSIPYWYLEAVLFGNWDYAQDSPASNDCTARRHANSSVGLQQLTTPASFSFNPERQAESFQLLADGIGELPSEPGQARAKAETSLANLDPELPAEEIELVGGVLAEGLLRAVDPATPDNLQSAIEQALKFGGAHDRKIRRGPV